MANNKPSNPFLSASLSFNNPLLASSTSFSLADSFGAAAALPVLPSTDEGSFVGASSSLAPPPTTSFSLPGLPTLPSSPFMTPIRPSINTGPQSVDLAPPTSPASPPRPLSTPVPRPQFSSSLAPATPQLFNPPPASTSIPSSNSKRPVYAPSPFLNSKSSVSSTSSSFIPGAPPPTSYGMPPMSNPPLGFPPMPNPTLGIPPMSNPTLGIPPMSNPTLGIPPMSNPSVGMPPMSNPSAGMPPMSNPSAGMPPMSNPPAGMLPMSNPPLGMPPMSNPLSSMPPMTNTPSGMPPMTNTPSGMPPMSNPLSSIPPMTNTPSGMPPMTNTSSGMFNPPSSQFGPTPTFPPLPPAPNISSPTGYSQQTFSGSFSSPPPSGPVTAHWFYKLPASGDEPIWKPFTVEDSIAIEANMERGETEAPVPVEGSRYDVYINKRLKSSVYWSSEDMEIRRCSWFYKTSAEGRWVPYTEEMAHKLEKEYSTAMKSGRWQCKVVFDNGEWVMLHSPEVMMHFPTASALSGTLDEWGQIQSSDPALKPRIVHRGLEGLPDIADGESAEVDHLFFVVHGIGSKCDIKFRNIIEVVDGFRQMAEDISGKHFAGARLASRANRMEFLPVNWHKKLHGEDTGTDARVQPLTLRSIPKLRSFINDTILDVLFYTSPLYCQTILDTVCTTINDTYKLYCQRNPGFMGKMSVIGHSLGSLILFDLLSGQVSEVSENINEESSENIELMPNLERRNSTLIKPRWDKDLTLEEVFEKLGISEHVAVFVSQGIGMEELESCSEEDLKEAELPLGPRKKLLNYLQSRKCQTGFQQFKQSSVTSSVDYMVGPAGTGQPSVRYPKLDVQPVSFFALGSPIGVFMAVRGLQSLGQDFHLPTCSNFFNIFHPYDPVSYRIESLVSSDFGDLRPILIPHHMGRKRMHLELKETMTRMGTDIKARVMESLKATMGAMYTVAGTITGQSVDTMVEQEMNKDENSTRSSPEPDNNPTTIPSDLNSGRRIDYVLQEAPMESFNEYLFALASHLCYWESEDTCLMVIREVYSTMDILPDDQLQGSSRPASVPSQLPSRPGPTTSMSHSPSVPSFNPNPSGAIPRNSSVPMGMSGYNPAPPPSTTSLGPPSTLDSFPRASSGAPPGPPPALYSPASIQTESGSQKPFGAYPRPAALPSFQSLPQSRMGMDPTAPLDTDRPIAPPPMGGFMNK